MKLSIPYQPNLQYSEIGYHKTFKLYKDNIIKNGFQVSNNSDDWLGEGIYFWDNLENANWWKGKSKNFECCIFVCNLKCEKLKYLNLDVEMDKFEDFGKKYLKEMAHCNCKKPSFKNSNETKKFFCDLYCKKNDIEILSFSFKHNIINKVGFVTETKIRRQICVKNNNNISIMSVL